MMNCKRCGVQLQDTEMICPICGADNAEHGTETRLIVCDEVDDIVDEVVEEKECKKPVKKIEKLNVNTSVQPVKYKEIGSRSQVTVSFSDGSNVCMKKVIAQSLYPQIFVTLEGDD